MAVTQTEAAAINALEASVTRAVEEFRLTTAREVQVSNEIHRDIKDILARQDQRISALETGQGKRLGALEMQMARLIGGLSLAGFAISIVGWQLWQAVVNR